MYYVYIILYVFNIPHLFKKSTFFGKFFKFFLKSSVGFVLLALFDKAKMRKRTGFLYLQEQYTKISKK